MGTQKLRIVYLLARYWWDKKMSPGRVWYGQAIQRHPDVELTITGAGWPDWDDAATVTSNFGRLGLRPDLIWVYKGQDYHGLSQAAAPRMVIFNEANDHDKTLGEIEIAGAKLILFHHENDIGRWRALEESGCTLRHVPHCSPVDVFHTHSRGERDIDCLLTGVQSDQIYPLRSRFRRLIESGQLPGVVRRHPGYRLRDRADCDRQALDYAANLGRAKIALCCTSIWRYPLAKQVEAAMAGCAVVTDMPDDSVFRSTLGRHVIEVSPDMPDAEICQVIRGWLDRPADLARLAEAGQRAALDGLTTSHYAERVVRLASEFLSRPG